MIEGRFFHPDSARSHAARLMRQAGVLRVEIEGQAGPASLRLASISDKLGSVPRKFTFDDGSVFEAVAGADVDAFMGSHHSVFSRLSRLEANGKLLVILVVITAGLLAAAYRWGIPALAHVAAAATPVGVVELIDATALQTIDGAVLKPSQLPETRQEAVRKLFSELSAISQQTAPALRLDFRDGGLIGANAFALPGGTILITDQLIQMAKSEDEIAGVLAHEIGHVQHRHSLQQIYRMLGISMIIATITGDASQIVDDVASQAALLQQLAYSREFEALADRRSAEIMVAAKRDPLAFVELLQRLNPKAENEAEDGWFSTHPTSGNRMQVVRDHVRALKNP